MSAVLTFGLGDLGNLLALVVGPKAAGNPLALVVGPKAAGEISAFCLGAAIFLASPGGELCGRGWSQLGGGHSGDALWRDLGGKWPRRWCTNRASYPASAARRQAPGARARARARRACQEQELGTRN
jgi:hypothetical protein